MNVEKILLIIWTILVVLDISTTKDNVKELKWELERLKSELRKQEQTDENDE